MGVHCSESPEQRTDQARDRADPHKTIGTTKVTQEEEKEGTRLL